MSTPDVVAASAHRSSIAPLIGVRDEGTRSVLDHEMSGAPGAPVVLALGGISATRHVLSSSDDPTPGWWEGLGGRGRALDRGARRVLGVEYLDGGTTAAGLPQRAITTRDQAHAIVELLDSLGVVQLDAAIGASYGGMVALALAERWPTRVKRVVVISAAHEPHPMATALRTLQRRIVELGVRTGESREAMIIARGLAMTTYRTAREFAERFASGDERGEAGSANEFAVENYLRHSGERFLQRMDAARFLALSLSADLHRVTPEQVRVPTALIAAQGDTLVPGSQMRTLATRLPASLGIHTLRSRRGHDAFLAETGRLSRLLTTILDN